jgi:hypothetical protein
VKNPVHKTGQIFGHPWRRKLLFLPRKITTKGCPGVYNFTGGIKFEMGPTRRTHMSALKSLTLTALPKAEHSPVQLRRSRLIERLEDQKSLLKNPAYIRVVQRWKKQGGQRVLTEKKLPVRPWWRTDEKGQVVFFVRVGWKPLEFEQGKAGVVAGTMEKLPAVIDTLIGAVRAGELDPMLEHAKTAHPAPKRKAA